ncbi:MAG: sigma factor-like helix-turn-helix DNA-binding protein [Nannocystaceae bacterium]
MAAARGVTPPHRRAGRRRSWSAATTPTRRSARRQAAAIVEAFLDDLDEDKRMVFVLADIEGLAMPQIAELLGIKLNTAYSRLRLARQHFHLAVSKHRDGGER